MSDWSEPSSLLHHGACGQAPLPGSNSAPLTVLLLVCLQHTCRQVLDNAAGVDLLAFDFYSRFQRPTAPSCERFAAAPGAPACKRNRLRWCHTDLGANVINYQRFVQENRRFGTLGVSLQQGSSRCGQAGASGVPPGQGCRPPLRSAAAALHMGRAGERAGVSREPTLFASTCQLRARASLACSPVLRAGRVWRAACRAL